MNCYVTEAYNDVEEKQYSEIDRGGSNEWMKGCDEMVTVVMAVVMAVALMGANVLCAHVCHVGRHEIKKIEIGIVKEDQI